MNPISPEKNQFQTIKTEKNQNKDQGQETKERKNQKVSQDRLLEEDKRSLRKTKTKNVIEIPPKTKKAQMKKEKKIVNKINQNYNK